MSELRKDPIIRRWIIVSDDRKNKFSEYITTTTEEEKHICPFCPGNESKSPVEILTVKDSAGGGSGKKWRVRVIPDKFPLLRIEGDLKKRGQGMYDMMNAVGAHEIVIETPDHDADWTKLEIDQLQNILGVYRQRALDLRKDTRFKHIIIVKNHDIPTTRYNHSHSHILAMPFVVKRVDEELNSSMDYFKMKERCIYCDMINEERNIGRRIIKESDKFMVYTPFASKFPFEICIIPKMHISDFGAITDDLLHDQAVIFKEIMSGIKKALKKLSYSMVLHCAPIQHGLMDEYHWHWEIMPRYSEMMGFEWGTGLYANPVLPEDAAKILREAILS